MHQIAIYHHKTFTI